MDRSRCCLNPTVRLQSGLCGWGKSHTNTNITGPTVWLSILQFALLCWCHITKTCDRQPQCEVDCSDIVEPGATSGAREVCGCCRPTDSEWEMLYICRLSELDSNFKLKTDSEHCYMLLCWDFVLWWKIYMAALMESVVECCWAALMCTSFVMGAYIRKLLTMNVLI